jgi:hypothetical protein
MKPHIRKKTTFKTSWSQDHLKAALAAGEKYEKLIFTKLL